MYVKWEKLKRNLDNPSYRNYVKTFGFLVVKNVLSKKEHKLWAKEYDRVCEEHFKVKLKKLMKKSGQAMVPNFVDSSPYFAKAAFDERFMSMAKYFCGDDFLYMGSDGSTFSKNSFKWHRDWYTQTPVLKFNVYLNPRGFIGGDFLIFPGSQIPSDSYSNLLNKGLAWPFGETVDGGMNERSYFPRTESPRGDLLKRMWSRLVKRKFELPYARLKVRHGDVVIFDQRAIHVVEKTVPQVTRRLLTLLFAENPKSLPDKHYTINPGRKLTREEMSKEISGLFWLERELIKIPPYGKYVDKKHPLYPNHLFTAKLTDKVEIDKSVNIDQYQQYADKFQDPSMKNILYTNNMLGFNLNNIRDIVG